MPMPSPGEDADVLAQKNEFAPPLLGDVPDLEAEKSPVMVVMPTPTAPPK